MRVLVVFAVLFALLVGYMLLTLEPRVGDVVDRDLPIVFGVAR